MFSLISLKETPWTGIIKLRVSNFLTVVSGMRKNYVKKIKKKDKETGVKDIPHRFHDASMKTLAVSLSLHFKLDGSSGEIVITLY